LRTGAYAPIGVGQTTAQTLRAFEQSCNGHSQLRLALPWLEAPAVREAGRVACALQIAQVLTSLTRFSQAPDSPPRLAFLRAMAAGRSSLDEAVETPAASRSALEQLDEPAWAGFRPTVLIETGGRTVVLAHHRDQPDLSLALVFQGDRPVRLDLLSFNACYGALP